jgi:hypothetical protein
LINGTTIFYFKSKVNFLSTAVLFFSKNKSGTMVAVTKPFLSFIFYCGETVLFYKAIVPARIRFLFAEAFLKAINLFSL